jgi:hypothetical protein
MMKLMFSDINSAWLFVFGDAPLRIEGEPLFFEYRTQAVEAAGRHGIAVAPPRKGGWCDAIEPSECSTEQHKR